MLDHTTWEIFPNPFRGIVRLNNLAQLPGPHLTWVQTLTNCLLGFRAGRDEGMQQPGKEDYQISLV